jgi:hypothetical protein
VKSDWLWNDGETIGGPHMKKEATTKSVTTHTWRLSSEDIIDLLSEANRQNRSIFGTSDEISVKFKVPSGGDWSGIDVDITEEDAILVTAKVSSNG